MTSERTILNQTRIVCGRLPGVVLYRNECGVATHGGRTVRYGLLRGSADLIGLRELIITPEHIGQTIAQFVAVECKTERGKLSEEQRLFLAMVARRGGLAVVARSAAEAAEALCR